MTSECRLSPRGHEASTGVSPWYPSSLQRNPPKHLPSLFELQRIRRSHSSMALRPWPSAKADKSSCHYLITRKYSATPMPGSLVASYRSTSENPRKARQDSPPHRMDSFSTVKDSRPLIPTWLATVHSHPGMARSNSQRSIDEGLDGQEVNRAPELTRYHFA